MSEPYVRAGNVKWIAKGVDVGVQERTLRPGDVIPWHYHSAITDTTYCLEGTVRIEMLEPPEHMLLTPGQSYPVPPRRPHRIMSEGTEPCRFLLVQGVGAYDRHAINPVAGEAPRNS